MRVFRPPPAAAGYGFVRRPAGPLLAAAASASSSSGQPALPTAEPAPSSSASAQPGDSNIELDASSPEVYLSPMVAAEPVEDRPRDKFFDLLAMHPEFLTEANATMQQLRDEEAASRAREEVAFMAAAAEFAAT